MFAIDQYAYQNRWKDLPAGYKLFIYLLLLAVSFSGVRGLQLALIALVAPLTCYVARLSWGRYLKWYLHASIFILISLLTFVLTYQDAPDQLLLALPLGRGYLGISQAAGQQTVFILLRIYSSLVSTYFFVLTVPFAQMLRLFKILHIPRVLLDLIVLMYRFIFLVFYEFVTIRDTLDLKFSFYNKRKQHQAWGRLANTLFSKLLDDNQKLNEVLALKFDAEHSE
ncbi:Transmembrane component CbiQ of energizing module of cobalt ECF transporter [Streptococcus sp. DD11]|uniref:CbiQ family ECF transporter T component n=1 Tax=Streptococcus sp. DD11 TaxID=1777879 RepID=UPI00079A9A1F|nr:CbiQ family ECF transporter T component [Streptococcus sp. DD11]KXT85888.1 Transmembrane component CbiQ of energizing module of cobalt ECF transporter [Streptococcus sp. DD11]